MLLLGIVLIDFQWFVFCARPKVSGTKSYVAFYIVVITSSHIGYLSEIFRDHKRSYLSVLESSVTLLRRVDTKMRKWHGMEPLNVSSTVRAPELPELSSFSLSQMGFQRSRCQCSESRRASSASVATYRSITVKGTRRSQHRRCCLQCCLKTAL